MNDLVPDDFQSLSSPLTIAVRIGETESVLAFTVDSITPGAAHRYRAAPFSMVLSGPRDPMLPQGTFAVQHPSRGLLHLFLVPIARDANATQYEVVFN